MKNAEEIIAGFYHYIKNSEVQDKRNNEAVIHKLNYLILFNPTPTTQDWVDSMIAFSSKAINTAEQTQMSENEQLNEIIQVLREHYNSLVTDNKKLTAQMFETNSKQPILSKTA